MSYKLRNNNKEDFMLLTITQVITKRGHARFNIECDGTLTHMLNAESLDHHLEHKMGLLSDQIAMVFAELNQCDKAVLELVPVPEVAAS